MTTKKNDNHIIIEISDYNGNNSGEGYPVNHGGLVTFVNNAKYPVNIVAAEQSEIVFDSAQTFPGILYTGDRVSRRVSLTKIAGDSFGFVVQHFTEEGEQKDTFSSGTNYPPSVRDDLFVEV